MDPETQTLGQLLPLLGVAEDAFQALADEWLDTVGLDLILGVDAEFLADFDLDRQPVRVPAGFPVAAETAHRTVAREKVLDGARKAVPGMREPVGGGRPFIEHERGASLPGFQGLLEYPPLLPEADDVFLELWKRNLTIDLAKHSRLLCPETRRNQMTKRPPAIQVSVNLILSSRAGLQ